MMLLISSFPLWKICLYWVSLYWKSSILGINKTYVLEKVKDTNTIKSEFETGKQGEQDKQDKQDKSFPPNVRSQHDENNYIIKSIKRSDLTDQAKKNQWIYLMDT